MIFYFSRSLCAQNIYELRKLTDDQWISMSTEERLNALSKANKHAQNQTFVGDFGKFYDLHKRWGYEFYEMEDRYDNYSFRGFENYNIIEERRRRWSYNEFGDRLVKMTSSGNIWHETYEGDGTFYVEMPNRYFNAMTAGEVDGVWVAREATDDWAFSAIGAGAIRTKFTPLTLSLPNMHGMRLDFQSENSTMAIVNSSLLGSQDFWDLSSQDFIGGYRDYDVDLNAKNTKLFNKGGALLRGGYFRQKFGALTVGASYVNEYGVQGNREGGDSWYGTVSNYAPTPIIVALRFMDDSPADGEGGPIIYDVRLKVNDKYRDDIIPVIMRDDVTRDRTTAFFSIGDQAYVRPEASVNVGKPKEDILSLEGMIPKYADFFFLRDYLNGSKPSNVKDKFNLNLADKYYAFVDPGSASIVINGTETVVYFFDLASIKEHANRVEAEITVANDYRIQTALIYPKDIKGGHDTSGKYASYYNATYWRTMAQAEGNVKDKSNVDHLTVDFGLQVASIVYGLDIDFNYREFKITGEYVTNASHYMFPDDVPGAGFPTDVSSGLPPRTGHKWSQLDNAYYITAQKDWQKIGFTGEIFKMGKFYRPYLDLYIIEPVSYRVNAVSSRNSFVRLPLIEDNDDDDQYPDTMVEVRGVGGWLASVEDPDGVFPGNDADNDGIPDNNKNNNSIPDYDEPFLMFDVDPDEFVFGNDYNNNTIPDFREDDMKLDTPYDLDRQGHHFSFRYTPVESVNLIVGSFRTHGVGVDNRTNDDYFKLLVNYNVFDVGKLYAEYRYERIQDDFRDLYMQIQVKMKEEFLDRGYMAILSRFNREVYYDELEYKNSRVNRLWLDSVIRAVPAITLENHVKLERNGQIEGLMYDNTYQPGETLTTLALVNKIVYTKKLGNWTFSPGIKFRFYKKDRSDIARPGDYYMTRIPLIMFKYDISDNTVIMLGLQGIPGFEFDFKDYVQSENDFKRNIYDLHFQNRSSYFGYDIWASSGIKFDDMEFTSPVRAFEKYKSSTLYVNVNLGW